MHYHVIVQVVYCLQNLLNYRCYFEFFPWHFLLTSHIDRVEELIASASLLHDVYRLVCLVIFEEFDDVRVITSLQQIYFIVNTLDLRLLHELFRHNLDASHRVVRPFLYFSNLSKGALTQHHADVVVIL